MKPTITKPKEEKWTMSFREFVGSFLYVLLYFILIEPLTELGNQKEILIGALILAIVYFAIGWYFKPHASVHLLPVVSFILFLENKNSKDFLLRTGGQLLGAFFAAFAFFLTTGGDIINYSLMVSPSHPFLTGLFTGILAVVIYFLYQFILRSQENAAYLQILFFSIGLGIIFYLSSLFDGITLLNPFGLLLHYLLPNPTFTISEFLVGLTVHILVPMFFILRVHFYINGFLKIVLKKRAMDKLSNPIF